MVASSVSGLNRPLMRSCCTAKSCPPWLRKLPSSHGVTSAILPSPLLSPSSCSDFLKKTLLVHNIHLGCEKERAYHNRACPKGDCTCCAGDGGSEGMKASSRACTVRSLSSSRFRICAHQFCTRECHTCPGTQGSHMLLVEVGFSELPIRFQLALNPGSRGPPPARGYCAQGQRRGRRTCTAQPGRP